MKAMILAAGKGTRMGALTANCPKTLLHAAGVSLIEHQIQALRLAGIQELVINVAYLGQQIMQALGDGQHFGVHIQYSVESEPLETAGGIIRALPLLGEQPFLVVNGDVWTDYAYAQLSLPAGQLAHLLLVDNPEHHPEGDFALVEGQAQAVGDSCYTFSGIGVYDPALFRQLPAETRRLAPVLREQMAQQRISAEYYAGAWLDVGTPERLQQLDQQLRQGGA